MSRREAAGVADYRILGPIEVWAGGRRAALGGTRAEQVLGVLLTEAGRIVPFERLIVAVWGEEQPTTARQQLHTAVARLRGGLRATGVDSVVITERSGYRAAVEDDHIDVGRFRRLTEESAAAAADGRVGVATELLERALGQWRGAALAGAGTTTLAALAARLDEQRLTAVERLAELRLADGTGAAVIADLRTWIADEPLRERFREHLMLALYRAGRRAEALEEFDRARMQLSEDLGLDPGPGLTSLHHRILHDDPALMGPGGEPKPLRPFGAADSTPHAGPNRPEAEAFPVPSLLPAPTSDFTGRGAELSVVLDAASRAADTPAVVTIDGMAGVGKTATAVQAAHALGEYYPDAHLFLDLHGHTPGRQPLEPADALETLLRGLGIGPDRIPADLTPRAALWRSALASRRVLIVLDNAADSAQVRPLLPGTSGSATVITSRRRLSGIDTATPLSLNVLSATAALTLFRAAAGAHHGESAAATDVIESCGRLPLAIRLAAARLRHRPAWTVSHLADRLRDQRHRLGRLTADDRSVSAAFAVSYDHLPADLQQMFRLLGLLPGPDVDVHAAAALAQVDLPEAEALLEGLLDHHLVLQTTPGRYTFHDLLRDHARNVAAAAVPAEERRAAVGRLYGYYLAGASAAFAEMVPDEDDADRASDPVPEVPCLPDHAAALAWVDSEFANLVGTIEDAAADGLHHHVIRIADLLQTYFADGCRHAAWAHADQQALRSARSLGDRDGVVRALTGLGNLAWARGHLEDAIRHHREASAEARVIGAPAAEAAALVGLAASLDVIGRYDEAINAYRRSVQLHRAGGRRHSEAISLMNLAGTLGRIGDVAGELAHLRDAEAIADRIDSEDAKVVISINTGSALLRLGRFPEAEERLLAALADVRRRGERRVVPILLSHLGQVHQHTGRLDEALVHLREAWSVAELNGVPVDEARVLNRLGDAERAAGHHDDAVARCERALGLAGMVGSRLEAARAHDVIARTHRDRHDVAAARHHWTLAHAVYDDIGAPEATRVRTDLAGITVTARF